ncbi:hypothetical protein [Stutzerimonas kunmingensis]|uniref:hypothetical protein n=1 Tax=Stutzerimonas kunmingensis TaxID=1211807 RepID=UPI00241CBFCB|nr:hypothetical protein [Stutzerimonas kunmingensis]
MYHVVLRGALLMLLGILASAHAFANATVLEVFVRDGCRIAAQPRPIPRSSPRSIRSWRFACGKSIAILPLAPICFACPVTPASGRRQCRHSSSMIRCTTCFAVLALSSRKLTERPGGTLKLISGAVMLPRGVVMLLQPQWLQ